jgi:hypothetical protein
MACPALYGPTAAEAAESTRLTTLFVRTAISDDFWEEGQSSV